jgi:hypothetical protein
MTTRDPQGKRALFTLSEAPQTHGDRGAEGKAALYSAATRRLGTLVLECSSCHGRTRVSYVDFAFRQLPFTVWTPWRRHSRLMRCPACGRRTWLSARWLE